MLGVAQNFDNLSVVIPYADGLDFDYPIGKSVYENMVAAATEKIFIMTPYLVLDDAFAELLANKAQSGVDVRIILPGVPDKKFVYSVSRSNAEKLMDYGVKVYCMENSFVHSKIVLTENCAVVGSINMDLRSFYQQFESAVYSNDEKFRADILADFERTIADSKPIDQKTSYRKNLLNRVWTGFLQIFAPFM
jgi:cardiolipin synthase